MLLQTLVHLFVAVFTTHGAAHPHFGMSLVHHDAWIATRHFAIAICRTNMIHGVQHCTATVRR